MPELPEVEVIRTALNQAFKKARLQQIEQMRPNLRYPLPPLQSLAGQQLIQITRYGKYMLWEFENNQLLWHLGMSGRWHILADQHHLPNQHCHVIFHFSNGLSAYYIDPRRFGFAAMADSQRFLSHLGVDPYHNPLDAEQLRAKIDQKKQAIKAALLDQHIIAGLGNIYVQEALFQAGIAPERVCRSLTQTEIQRLCLAITVILKNAVAAGGSTLRDFYRADGRPGFFALQHQVYGRSGKLCFVCQSALLSQSIGNRSTVWCPKCQQ